MVKMIYQPYTHENRMLIFPHREILTHKEMARGRDDEDKHQYQKKPNDGYIKIR